MGGGAPRHFLDLMELDHATLRGILDHARAMKAKRRGLFKGELDPAASLAGRILAMVFEKPSTRTRVSFDVAMRQMGGQTMLLTGAEIQFAKRESITDTAQVLSRYVDAIMVRMVDHSELVRFAASATVPVINGLTAHSHPCQIMADLMTLEEHKGELTKLTVAWSGDGNNVATSWIHAAALMGFKLRLGCPPELAPDRSLLDWAQSKNPEIKHCTDPKAAVDGADCIVTDAWLSMGDREASDRYELLRPYQVDKALMQRAKPDAAFMHCLPVHRGEEVTPDVIDGASSVVFDEAENRLHAQKGILAWSLRADLR